MQSGDGEHVRESRLGKAIAECGREAARVGDEERARQCRVTPERAVDAIARCRAPPCQPAGAPLHRHDGVLHHDAARRWRRFAGDRRRASRLGTSALDGDPHRRTTARKVAADVGTRRCSVVQLNEHRALLSGDARATLRRGARCVRDCDTGAHQHRERGEHRFADERRDDQRCDSDAQRYGCDSAKTSEQSGEICGDRDGDEWHPAPNSGGPQPARITARLQRGAFYAGRRSRRPSARADGCARVGR